MIPQRAWPCATRPWNQPQTVCSYHGRLCNLPQHPPSRVIELVSNFKVGMGNACEASVPCLYLFVPAKIEFSNGHNSI